MLKKNEVFKYSNLDDVAKYINMVTSKLNYRFKKQKKVNKFLAVLCVVNTAVFTNEINNLKKEIEELKNKKGV